LEDKNLAKNRSLSEEDAALFRKEVAQVSPLCHDRIQRTPKQPGPLPRKSLEDERATLRELLSDDPNFADLETGDELLFMRPGLQNKLLRKLRRGQFSVGAELDMHGLTVAEAHGALPVFLKECRLRGFRCVRIIHGKGLRSRNGRPVIKGKLDRWLRLREEVIAFCSARSVDGGTGAVYVLLKRQ
jgi:DNA-nicking Smr family endonuclease